MRDEQETMFMRPVHWRPFWWMAQGFLIGLAFYAGRLLGRFDVVSIYNSDDSNH